MNVCPFFSLHPSSFTLHPLTLILCPPVQRLRSDERLVRLEGGQLVPGGLRSAIPGLGQVGNGGACSERRRLRRGLTRGSMREFPNARENVAASRACLFRAVDRRLN